MQCPFCNNINIPAWSHSSTKCTLSCECTEVASSHNSQRPGIQKKQGRRCQHWQGTPAPVDVGLLEGRWVLQILWICSFPCSAYRFSCELHELQEIVMMGRLAGQNSESCEGRRRSTLPEVSLSQQCSLDHYSGSAQSTAVRAEGKVSILLLLYSYVIC